MANNNGWSKLVAFVAVLVYVVYFAAAWYTFQNLPPLPDEVRSENGELLFTRSDIVEGKYIVQRYGLQDYGSFLGFGGYFGMDYTAYIASMVAQRVEALRLAAAEAPAAGELVRIVEEDGKTVMIVAEPVAAAYRDAVQFFRAFFNDEYGENRLADGLLSSSDVEKAVAFFTWGTLIAMAGYTNGFPYQPGLIEPSFHAVRATWVTIFILLLVIMPLAGYIIVKFIDYWKSERITVELPPPSPAQRLALLGMLLAALGLGVQGLLGGYMMHLYAEPGLYGVELENVLPFNVARGLHYNLAILWIAVTWVSFALFTLPYFGVNLSRGQVLAILAAGATVSLGALLGLWLSYLGRIPEPLWFIVGSQGRPVVSAGTLWLTLIGLLLLLLSLQILRAARSSSYPFSTLLKILAVGVAGTGAGALVGAAPFVKPWSHFTVDEYFRWITIHSFVEGFWPAIIIPILLILLVIAGLVPPKLAVAVAGIDASLEIATGMIGTAHHYYWGGEPSFWMYLGAAVSTLEVLPIGFLIAYALVLWRRGEVRTELQKTLLTFVLVAAFGGAIGVVAFGAGLINMPVINYYLHGSQATMVHAHLAMPLAYGVPTMLLWVVALYLSGGIDDRGLRLARKAAVIIAAGFYLQVALSLGILMLQQFDRGAELGYWAIKGPVTPTGEPGIWEEPLAQTAIWARLVGDMVAAAGIAILIILMLRGVPKALRGG